MCVRLSVRARVSVSYEKRSVVCYSSMHRKGEAEKAERHAGRKKGAATKLLSFPMLGNRALNYCTSTIHTRFTAHLRSCHVVTVQCCGESSKSQTDRERYNSVTIGKRGGIGQRVNIISVKG